MKRRLDDSMRLAGTGRIHKSGRDGEAIELCGYLFQDRDCRIRRVRLKEMVRLYVERSQDRRRNASLSGGQWRFKGGYCI